MIRPFKTHAYITKYQTRSTSAAKFRPWLEPLEVRLTPSTYQDFDGTGDPFVTGQHSGGVGPVPAPVAGGPTGDFMRVAGTTVAPQSDHGAISFARTDTGAFGLVIADFDFRITPQSATSRADGLSFIFLNTADHGNSGIINPPNVAEEPNFAGSLAIGFDLYDAAVLDNDVSRVSVHFRGAQINETDVSAALDLASGRVPSSGFAHARIIMRPSVADVTVILTPAGGVPATVINQLPVSGFIPYEGRVQFSARSGGEAADFDLDNVMIQYLNPSQSVLSFRSRVSAVAENDGFAVLTVERAGGTQSQVTVEYATISGSAIAGADFATTTGTLVFAAGVTQQSFQVPVTNDALHEGAGGVENLTVNLFNATGGAFFGEPRTAVVKIIDDERSREIGHWSDIHDGPGIVGVHLHLLPTGQVMFFNRHGQMSLWSPSTDTFSTPALPEPMYDLFCSGHNFLADGRLFVTGGHEAHDGNANADGDGVDFASVYDPFANQWTRVDDMLSGGRWYPTNTMLANGDVAVLSGSTMQVAGVYLENKLPQVYDVHRGDWRNLTDADPPAYPSSVDLYPRNFLDPSDPDGTRIFRAGPDRDTKLLETTGQGNWVDGPEYDYPGNRTYGTAIAYEPGKIMIAGGDLDPTNTAEVIDLSTPLEWKFIADAYPGATTPNMAFDRRHLNSTMLPDGTVLVTGGSTADGFTDVGPVFAAEMWNPDTGNWTTWASMQIRRHYHGTALLLPDGRVLSMGGGDGGGVQDQTSFEIFSPPYLFGGPRPQITGAPGITSYGRSFFVQTPDPANIREVALVRLGSVTHAFDQNQAFITLGPPTQVAGGINVTAPAGPTLAPPGHYMMFLLDNSGVPSVAKIIHIGEFPDLRVTITSNPRASVTIPNALTYTVTITNDGPYPASGVTLTNTLPTNVNLLSIQASQGTVSATGNVVNANIGSLVSGGSATIRIIVKPFHAGRIVNNVIVQGALPDPNPGNNTATLETQVNPFPPFIVTGPGSGSPRVRVFDANSLATRLDFFAYPGFAGGVRVATGDINRDGVPDIITAANTGTARVKVFDGQTGGLLKSFLAFPASYKGGISVAAGDINGDGFDDIVVGTLVKSQVKVFDGVQVTTGANPQLLRSFVAFGAAYIGGVTVAAGDINHDGRDEVIVAKAKRGSQVKVYNGLDQTLLRTFNAYALAAGVFVSAGDYDGDGFDDIFTGTQTGKALVRVYRGLTHALLANFLAFGGKKGVRVDAVDYDGDGRADIVVSAGPDRRPEVRVFDDLTLALAKNFLAYQARFRGGIFVAAG